MELEKEERYPTETAGDYAFRIIKEDIITLKLKPDTMISEKILSIELGISRTPVREALNNLSQTGIIEIIPQTGIYITKIDYNLVEEARFLRLQLELGVVKKLCNVDGHIDYTELEQNLKLQEFYMMNDDRDNFFALDNKFHELLFEYANKPQSHQIMKNMQIHFDRVRRLNLETVDDPVELLNDHKSIVTALINKDTKKSRELIRLHLSRYEIDRKFLENKYNDYF